MLLIDYDYYLSLSLSLMHILPGGLNTLRMCGYQNRNSRCFESWSNELILDFFSDRMFEGNGYKATYRFVPDNYTGVSEYKPV